ncbi:MAG: LTA synthase family protein [Bacilli bacterium]|nr:LTA synthase family protein [Bacilli bacterium]
MEKKYYIKKYVLITLIMFISLLFIELSFKIMAFHSIGIEIIRIILFNLFYSLVIAFILQFLKPLPNKIIILIINSIYGLYGIIQLTFKNLIGNYLSLSASTNNGLNRVQSQIKEFISCIRIEYFILLIPFIFFLIFFIVKRKIQTSHKINTKSIVIRIIVIIIVYILGYLTLVIPFFQNKKQIKSNLQLYKSPTLIELSLKQFGLVKFLERDIFYIFNHNDSYSLVVEKKEKKEKEVEPEKIDYTRYIDDTDWQKKIDNESNQTIKEVHNYFVNQDITDKNEYTGYFEGKNLVLVMIEAFDIMAINEDLTPTLYKLKTEGWYFDNYYAPVYSCATGESEYISETSIIPSSTVCTPNSYQNNNYYNSIFNLFNRSDYYTSSYHNWKDEFYDRTTLHENMGSQLYLDHDPLHIINHTGWPSDLELFENSLEYYIDKDKFFTFVITSSTHFPYDYDTYLTQKYWNQVSSLPYSSNVKRYIAKAMELDAGLEFLMKNLEEKGILDDTVIILFGDHHPLKMSYNEINEASSYDRLENYNIDKLPFIIYNSASEAKTISKTASTFDILPTVANLFNLDYDPRDYMGIDIFSDEDGIVIFNNGSWITDKCIYKAVSGNFIPLNDAEITDEYIQKINKIVNDKFYISDKVLTQNYFKYKY